MAGHGIRIAGMVVGVKANDHEMDIDPASVGVVERTVKWQSSFYLTKEDVKWLHK